MADVHVKPHSGQLTTASRSETVLRFRSPSRPIDEVLLNLHDTQPIILDRPDQATLLRLLKGVEQQYIHSFWENVLCKLSPYFPQLPFALASWSTRRISLLSPSAVLRTVCADYMMLGLAAPGDIGSVSFDSLVKAIRSMEPATIQDALKILSRAGIQRINASPIIQVGQDCADFVKAVEQLVQRAGKRDGRIAAMALVALRAAGFIVLPSMVVKRVRLFDSLGADGGWGSLINVVTPALKELHDQLRPPTLREGGSLYKNTTFRIYSAILSTSARSVDDVSWPLLYSLLKGTDFYPELRNHWRELGRRNLKGSDVIAIGSGVPEEEVPTLWSVSDTLWADARTCENFTDPSGTSSEILLNVNSSAAILLKSVTKAELRSVLQQLEQHWINVFWSTLTSPSPYNQAVPFGLEATEMGHALVDPVLVASVRSGHLDLNSRESLDELRLLGREQLTDLINKLRPSTLADCFGVLTKNGEQRLKGFSLLEVARRSASFGEFVEILVHTATEADERMALAISALIVLRSHNWLVLPLSIPRALSKVQRGVNGTTTEWIRDPILELSGEARRLMNDLLGPEGLADTDRHTSGFQTMATIAILCSNLRRCEQLSIAFVERILAGAHETTLCSPAKDTVRIRTHWTKLCERNGPIAMLPPAKIEQDHRSELISRCGDPRLDEWRNLLSERCAVHTGANLEPVYHAYATWLKWLSSLPAIPGIFEISRCHISGIGFAERGYREYLQELAISTKQKNARLFLLSDVFEHLATQAEADGRRFSNPIRTHLDKFYEDSSLSGQGTYRSRIPSLVLDEMKLLIVEPTDDGAFRWSPHLEKIRMLFSPDVDTGEEIFCPILPAIIYIMLVFPLRTHQARWLDSSEMDEEKYDFANNRFVPNSEQGIKGRRSGVIQPAEVVSSSPDVLLDFQVAVNKTTVTQRMRSAC